MSANDSLLEVYIYENLQLLEKLETTLLAGEKSGEFTSAQIDEIFRVLHTIKGSSAMMGYDPLAKLSHAIEDVMAHIRDNKGQGHDHKKVCDLVFAAADFIRGEIDKLQAGGTPDKDSSALITEIRAYYELLKAGKGVELPAAAPKKAKAAKAQSAEPVQPVQKAAETAAAGKEAVKAAGELKKYKALVFFQKDCKMENVRAFGLVNSLESMCEKITTVPEDCLQAQSEDEIVSNGFLMLLETREDPEALKNKIKQTFFLQSLEFEETGEAENTEAASTAAAAAPKAGEHPTEEAAQHAAADTLAPQKTNYMSVRLDKLDKLMDLVGEIVITESTVTKNPHILNLRIDSFDKAARQLRKLTDELQDIVMSIRMIPVSATFHKMERIVRDMARKTEKQAELIILGEDTELDKNVIDNLSDPLMHIIRNAMDHGIENAETRAKRGKDPMGKIVLEARNSGGEVLILISDDGQGLDRQKLIQKGLEKGLIKKSEAEVTDKEAYSLIFAPGFSTKDQVTEFSGRGVGMDVAVKNIERMGGSISVDSEYGKGMTVQMRIPLTLAIIDGMQVGVGRSVYIIPLLTIKESFKPKPGDVFRDPDGNEMIMIRGNCYAVTRLHELLGAQTDITRFEDGILVMVEADRQTYCLFVDRLIGEQQTVIKPLPMYISRLIGWIKSVSGCTILGDGSISLILDINGLTRKM